MTILPYVPPFPYQNFLLLFLASSFEQIEMQTLPSCRTKIPKNTHHSAGQTKLHPTLKLMKQVDQS